MLPALVPCQGWLCSEKKNGEASYHVRVNRQCGSSVPVSELVMGDDWCGLCSLQRAVASYFLFPDKKPVDTLGLRHYEAAPKRLKAGADATEAAAVEGGLEARRVR